MIKTSLFLSILSLILISCDTQPSINGLWVIESVKVGEEDMTPNARWVRFNADYSQQSGNGWFQHSVGTWSLNENTNQLTVIDTNGTIDSSEPFRVSFYENNMIWKREEEGQQVEVRLRKTDTLPQTFGDKLLGLWLLEEAKGDGGFFTESESSNNSLFLRWDRRFVIRTEQGRVTGVYNVHGHRPELELIPYGEQNRSFWRVEYGKDTITLSLLNSEKEVIRTFKRINEFPE